MKNRNNANAETLLNLMDAKPLEPVKNFRLMMKNVKNQIFKIRT